MDRRICEPLLERSPTTLYENIRTKDFLRRVLEERGFPSELVERRKTGFFTPIRYWYQHELRRFVDSTIFSGGLMKTGVFEENAVRNLLANVEDNWQLIGSLVNLEIWHRVTFGDREGRSE